MDIIFITDLKIYTTIGVHPWEQAIKQPVFLDVELRTDTIHSAANDAITATLNYEDVYNEINKFLQENSFLLVETLANRLVDYLFQQFTPASITLKVSKKNTTIPAQAVGVLIQRNQSSNKVAL